MVVQCDYTKHIKNLCNVIMAIMIIMTMLYVHEEKLEECTVTGMSC